MIPNTACMNRPEPIKGYWVLSTWIDDAGWPSQSPQYIANAMSTRCRSDQDIGRTGPCKGCTRPQDHDYFERMGLK